MRPVRPPSIIRLTAALLVAAATLAGSAAAERDLDPPPDDTTPGRTVITPIPRNVPVDRARADLGASLFSDPRLSRSGSRSCASCHDLATNGADAAVRATAPDGTPLARNTTTVFNAALSFRLGWDGKTATLEQQADQALTAPEFMGETWSGILAKLDADPALRTRFRRVYGRGPDREAVLDAIASFERTLLTPDGRFDAWLRGDQDAISGWERAGYELFRGIGCASCHQGVNVGGNLYQKVGVFSPWPGDAPETLRVPSLRNVAVTAPYFDDGSAATLDEAVRRMATSQLGRDLTAPQIEAIVAFLETLTGTYGRRPVAAPPAASR